MIGRFPAAKLAEYLNERMKRGERLDGDSPVIAPKVSHRSRRGANAKKPHISTSQISKIVREVIREAIGKDGGVRPYDMRAFFATQMLTAEARVKVTRDFRTFWMGHSGTMLDEYTTHRDILPDQLVDEMLEAFRRAEPLLELAVMPAPKEQEDERAGNDGAPDGDGQRGDGPGGGPGGGVVVDARRESRLVPYGYVAARPRQRAVNADEAAVLINQGCRFVRELSNGVVIVEEPHMPPHDDSVAA